MGLTRYLVLAGICRAGIKIKPFLKGILTNLFTGPIQMLYTNLNTASKVLSDNELHNSFA